MRGAACSSPRPSIRASRGPERRSRSWGLWRDGARESLLRHDAHHVPPAALLALVLLPLLVLLLLPGGAVEAQIELEIDGSSGRAQGRRLRQAAQAKARQCPLGQGCPPEAHPWGLRPPAPPLHAPTSVKRGRRHVPTVRASSEESSSSVSRSKNSLSSRPSRRAPAIARAYRRHEPSCADPIQSSTREPQVSAARPPESAGRN